MDKNGNEIEPDGEVSVKLELKKLPEGVEEGTELEIGHIKNTAAQAKSAPGIRRAPAKNSSNFETVEKNVEAKKGAEADFDVKSFSTFTISWYYGY